MADTNQKLTKDEKKALRKEEWQVKLQQEQKKQFFQKIGAWIGIIALIGGGFWLLIEITSTSSTPSTFPSSKIAPISKKDLTIGNPQAKVQIVEYADFQCPGCKEESPILNQIIQTYQNKIWFAYRFFPLTQIHRNAMLAAENAYAAYLQGKFWPMHDLLFANQDSWADADNAQTIFNTYAKQLGLNISKLNTDANAAATSKLINAEEDEGTNAGVNSTPSIFINKQKIEFSDRLPTFQDLKKIIDHELSKK